MVQAFAERAFNNLWGLSLIGGIPMVVLASWVSGEFSPGARSPCSSSPGSGR